MIWMLTGCFCPSLTTLPTICSQPACVHGSVLKINGTGQALLTLRTTNNSSDRGIAFQNAGNAYVASINVEDAGSDTGDLVKMALKKGDRVLYGKYSGTEIAVDGDDVLIMRESDILATL